MQSLGSYPLALWLSLLSKTYESETRYLSYFPVLVFDMNCPSKTWKYGPETQVVYIQFSSVQSFSRIWLFANPWTTARQASQSITNSRSLPKLISIESVMPSNHRILCCPLLLLPSIFSSIRVFSNESAFRIRWPKYWSFSFQWTLRTDLL